VVEFVKLGRKGKLLDQVIGWGGGSWRSEPSRKVPQWLRSEIIGLLCARASQRAAEAASGSCAERQQQAAARAMAFPSFLSAELLAAGSAEASLPGPAGAIGWPFVALDGGAHRRRCLPLCPGQGLGGGGGQHPRKPNQRREEEEDALQAEDAWLLVGSGLNSRKPASGWSANCSIVSACWSSRAAVAALLALPIARHTTLGGNPRDTLRSRQSSSKAHGWVDADPRKQVHAVRLSGSDCCAGGGGLAPGLSSLRPSFRRASAGIGPAAAPHLDRAALWRGGDHDPGRGGDPGDPAMSGAGG
jgi:hypothetical protein